MDKIDFNLVKVFSLTSSDALIVCLVYVNNFDKAKSFFKQNNIRIIKEYKFLNLMAIKSNKQIILNFANLPFVKYITKSCRVTALNNVSKKIMGVDKLSFYGNNVTVAVIDTGISPHFDFVIGKNRIKKFIDLVNGREHFYDDNGHGTFVSGVLCGSGLMSHKKYSGFAPCADIVSIKALDKNGEANALLILDAMEWIYLNHKQYNIKVVCMSFGSEPLSYNDPIMRGAEKLWASGIVVTAAAGNSGPKYQTIKSPGISSKIITVGGFNDNRIGEDFLENYFEIAEFSSRGPAFNKIKPDMVAPSVDITSCSKDNSYVTLSGTSVATPMIAGMCALIIEKYPHLKPDQVKKMLIKCCRGITYNYNLEGMGYPKIT